MSQRPAPFAARSDLSVYQVQHGAQWYWVLKDPLRNELFRLRADQYALFQLLDGRRSLEEIRAALVDQFRDLTVSLANVQELVADLFRKGLLWPTRSGQAGPLGRRQRAQRRGRLAAAVRSPLFIRLPGWDPSPLLDRVYPWIRGVFHPAALLAGGALVVAMWCVALVRFDEFYQRAPALHDAFAGGSLLVIWAAVAAAKTLHEFGHALACRHYGGECHEIGVALMMFSPSMYCDVSDADRLPSRAVRLAIGAAGMYVELVLSAVAFALWWNTRPGLLHHLSWAVFLATQVSVVAFNLNPLLRLDGYYMLCDWLGVPNLRQKADRLLGRWLGRTALGLAIPDDPLLPQSRRPLLACYSAASALFRLQVVGIVSLLLYRALKPYGMQTVGLLVGLSVVALSVASGVKATVRAWREHRHRSGPTRRPHIAAAVAVAGLAAALLAPFPIIATAPLIIEPVGAQQVYVTSPGRLTAIRVRPGQRVRRGQPLVELANRELVDEVEQLETSCQVQQVAIAVHQAVGDAARASAAIEIRNALEEDLADRREALARLTLPAPCDGVVIAAAAASPGAPRAAARITGSPLDRANLGAYLAVGTPVLTLAPGDDYDAVLLIDQLSQADFAAGRRVRIKLRHAPQQVLHGEVVARSAPSDDLRAAEGAFAQEKNAAAREAGNAPHARLAQARVKLDDSGAPLLPGLPGQARALVWRQSLASWLWRQARHTFSFL